MRSAFRRCAAAALAVITFAGGAGAALAQVPTVPESMTAAPFLIRRPPSDLEALTRVYNSSDWAGLQARARDIICIAQRDAAETIEPDDSREYESCAASSGEGATAAAPRASGADVATALDLQRNHVAVMWLGSDAFGKPQLMRVVVHRTSRPPYSLDLPGVSSASRDEALVELFLSRSPLGRITSLYTSTRENDPLLAQLPAFIQALAGPLFATIGTIAGNVPGVVRETVEVPPRPKLAATVKRVGLPFRRAEVRLQAMAREPISTAGFAQSARRLASSLSFSDLAHSPCARALATSLATELPVVTQASVCTQAAAPNACLAAFDVVLSSQFDAAVASCEGGKPTAAARRDLETVDEKFRALVESGTSTTADLDVTFKNRPPSRFAFGAGSAVIARASLTRSRVTTKNGVLVADPLARVMTMAFVNWSPLGYDAQDPHLSAAERFRGFFGAALTPDFGPAAGLNVLLVRGIGVTVGGAFLFGKGADAQEIGSAPVKPVDPYRLSIARTVFAGISYSYK